MDTDYLSTLSQTVAIAIAEDVIDVDITARLIAHDKPAEATVVSRESAIICGRPWVDEVFRQVDANVAIIWHQAEGSECKPNAPVLTVSGNARSLLTAERTALNFLQTLSGTATTTARYAALIEHTTAVLLDTRKTLPGLRRAQKYAVRTGGGANHRLGLSDAFLIKENHIAAAGSITEAITSARSLFPERRVQVEVESIWQLQEACEAGPDWIMLDNFELDDLRTAVSLRNERAAGIRLEASGGIESDHDLVDIAETGVDFISIGALTKHLRAIDLSMRLAS